MDGSLRWSLAFVAVLLIATTVPPLAVADSGANGLGLQQTVDPDLVNLNVEIHEDGDATWKIEYLVRLRTENETQAFEDLMADVEENESAFLDRFESRMATTVSDAAEATGRNMSAQDFAISAEIRTLGNRYGVLTYTFTWTNFAAVQDDTITAGDALEGFFLDEQTTLQFAWPEGYELSAVSPEPTSVRDQSVVWQGQLDFASGQPRLSIVPATGTTTTTEETTVTTSPGTTETTDPDEETSIWVWILGGIVVLAILAGALWYLRERGGAPGPVVDEDHGDEPPADLMSNEERVEQFLESQGGRSKQQEIVEGLGWTEAKTSQVLSDMQESGRIEKFRIGRENVVKLPDTDGESD